MAYRERPVQCPRCNRELTRETGADVWNCLGCKGALVGIEPLIDALLEVAPDLMPKGGVRSLPTFARRSKERLLVCPTCRDKMEPVFLGGIDVDRCFVDQQIWFDPTEHARVLEVADEQRRERSWWSRLFGLVK